MEVLLNKISETILQYRDLDDKLSFEDGAIIQGMTKNLSSNLFLLLEHLKASRTKYYHTIKTYQKAGDSNAKATAQANVDVPEYDYLKRIYKQANQCFEAMRSNQSFIKSDRQHGM